VQCTLRLIKSSREVVHFILATSIEGIHRVLGVGVADNVQSEGIEHIHRFMDIAQIAEVTNVIYDLAKGKTQSWVAKIAPAILNSEKGYYFESSPSIRFITPYDHMAEGLKALETFTHNTVVEK